LPIRVVIDTSSLISFLLSGGKTMRSIIAAWRDAEISLLLSPQTLAELSSVVARPEIRRHTAIPLAALVDGLSQYALHVPGTLELAGACRDPKDDKFLACAVEGQAAYLISSDRDLLEMGKYQDVCILNPGQFLAALQLAKMSIDTLQAQYSLPVLQTILAEFCLDPDTRHKLRLVIARLSKE
jgi:putative PIN family toxin of toxin-antitoxin system